MVRHKYSTVYDYRLIKYELTLTHRASNTKNRTKNLDPPRSAIAGLLRHLQPLTSIYNKGENVCVREYDISLWLRCRWWPLCWQHPCHVVSIMSAPVHHLDGDRLDCDSCDKALYKILLLLLLLLLLYSFLFTPINSLLIKIRFLLLLF